MEDYKIKQISISFENKEFEQNIAKYIKEKKRTIGVSQYIKQLVINDMSLNKINCNK